MLLLQSLFCQQFHRMLRIRLALLNCKLEQHFRLARIFFDAVSVQIHDAHVQRGGGMPLRGGSVGCCEEVQRFGVVAVAITNVSAKIIT
jgi:hypothetical protein